jgi:redox-sensitive bicupin YhaK (pirin superfamily)
MSHSEAQAPECSERESDLAMVIESRMRDIGDFELRRLLPAPKRRLVGPYTFFDHFGPVTLAAGKGMEVRPHPHINLATVTYLFEGAIEHRDSLGSQLTITPGAINWMTAGKGIVHSERTPEELLDQPRTMHGIQLWLALPTESEEIEPAFRHYPQESFPIIEEGGVRMVVLIGTAYGSESPVETVSPTLYIDAHLQAGATLKLEQRYDERAVYVVEGSISHGGEAFGVGKMLVMKAGGCPEVTAVENARVVVLGGDTLDGERHLWWNFVSSSKERLEEAKQDWLKGPGASDRFPLVPGDSDEFIPLPEA